MSQLVGHRIKKTRDFRVGDVGLAGVDFEEDLGVAGEDLGVGALGDVGVGREVVEDDAGAGEVAGADGFESEEGVVETAEAVRDDDDDGEIQTDGEVGEGFGFRDRDQPTAGAFDEERGVFGEKFVEPIDERIEREGAVFELRGDEGGGGGLEPDGVGFVERERIVRGGAEDFDIGAFAAAEGLEGDGAEAGLAEGAGEERGGKGFSDAGVGAGEKEVHAEIGAFEKCSIFRYGEGGLGFIGRRR